MTNEEAIKGLLNVKMQMFEESPFTEAVDLAIKTLEKQIPKKPIIDIGYDTEGNVWNDWQCPCCRKSYLLDEEEYNYCFECGQSIDWTEGAEE